MKINKLNEAKKLDEAKQLNETEYGKDELWNQINNNEWAYNSLANKVKTAVEKGLPKERIVHIVRNAIASMRNDFGRIPTTQADRLELARDFVEDELQGYSFEDGDPDVLPWKRTGTWSKLGEAFKPSDSGIQSVKVYNPYNYTIQELRVDNDNKTFERGNFTAGKADKKTKNRQEYEDVVDTLKELGYTEIKSDYRSLRNKTRKGIPTSVEEGYELSPRIDYNPNHLRDDEGKIMADRWYASKWPDDEVGIEQLKGITLDDALKDRNILGHCDTQVRERVYAQLDRYIPLSVDSPMYKEKNESKESEESELITQYINNGEFDKLEKVKDGTNVIWKLKEPISESNNTYYVTVYEEVSTSGPEEGGYTNFGWEATHSKKFNTKADARKYLNDFVDGAEVIYNSGDTMEIKDEWGDTYKIRIESENERGSSNAPAKTWAEAEMGVEFDRPFFDDEGKRLPEDPAKTRAREEEKKALENEYLNRINALKTMDDIIALLSDSRYGKFVKYGITDKYRDKIDDKIMEIRKGTTNESLDSDIEIETIGDYIVDHYDFDDIDDKYNCINSIRDSFKDEKTISKEELEQFIGAHNGRDKVNENLREDVSPNTMKEIEWLLDGIINIGPDDKINDQDDWKRLHTTASRIKKQLSKETLDESSYGGAFDIRDDQYFTREDLDDFAEEVLNHINETFVTQFDVRDCYLDDGVLELEVTNDEYGDYNWSEKIDMRKIKEPWHLKRAYATWFASQLINDITQANDGLIESYDDDVDEITYYYEDEVFKHNLETNPYTEIESKQVLDADGFMTDYTMYMDINTGEYVFILGDKDVYCPDNGYFYFDWECETEEEAKEWFDNYVGFDDELVDECWSSKLEEEAEESPIIHKKSDGSYLVQSDSGDGYTAFNKDNVCQGHISASNENEAKNKFNSNNFDE